MPTLLTAYNDLRIAHARLLSHPSPDARDDVLEAITQYAALIQAYVVRPMRREVQPGEPYLDA